MLEAWYVRFAFGYSYFLFILFGFFYIVFNKRIRKDKVFYSVLLPYITMNLMIVVGGVSYSYYGLPNSIFAFIGVLIVSINIFGGFAVTRRMLAMFRKQQ